MNAPARVFEAAHTPLARGITLLEASAGTGKTWSITTAAVRLLAEPGDVGLRVESIARLLLVTFTNAAADELRVRLRERLRETLRAMESPDDFLDHEDDFLVRVAREWAGDPGARLRLRQALLDFDMARVQTIHAFCAQVLREAAFEAGLPLSASEAGEAAALQRAALEDQWRVCIEGGPAWRSVWAAVQGRDLLRSLEKERAAWRRHREARLLPEAPAWDEIDEAVGAALREAFVTGGGALVTALRESVGRGGKRGGTKSPPEREIPGALDAALDAMAAADSCEDPRWVRGLLLFVAPGLENRCSQKMLVGLGSQPWHPALARLDRACQDTVARLRLELFEGAQERFARFKRRARVLDYDDLIDEVHRAVTTGGSFAERLRGSIDVALIDEFQDTDERQWEIFRALFADRGLVLVGDPKQAIYAFRGADVFAYLRARESAQRVFTLDRNFRSHPLLLDALNTLYTRRDRPFVLEQIDYERVRAGVEARERTIEGDARPPLLIEWVPDAGGGGSSAKDWQEQCLQRTVDEVQRLVHSACRLRNSDGIEDLHPGHIAVLVRKRAQARAVRDALAQAGVRAVLRDTGDVHASESMRELGHLLAAILTPNDRPTLRRAMATRLFGATAEQIASLREDPVAEAEVLERFDHWARLWRRYGVLVALDRVVEDQDVVRRWACDRRGLRWMTDLRHAAELVQREEMEAALSPEGTLHWLRREQQRDHESLEDRRLRLESDERAVQILTEHASKGLQFEVVLLPLDWKSTRPQTPWFVHLDRGSQDRPARTLLSFERELAPRWQPWARVEREAEDQRLLYVALTRAKRRCVVWATPADEQEGALAYWLYRPPAEEGEDEAGYLQRARQCLHDGVEGWEAQLTEIVEGTPGTGWRLEHAPSPGAPARAGDEPPLRARGWPEAAEARFEPWIRTSFTGLTRFAGSGGEEAFEEGTMAAERIDPASSPLVPATPPRAIFAFARGPAAGVCLHSILEYADFERPVDATARMRFAAILRRHGLDDPAAHPVPIDPLEVACSLVETVRHERFPLGGFSMATIDRAHRLDEWGFQARLGRLYPAALATVFARHGEGLMARELPGRLRGLDARAVHGFLDGFVDLLFEHDGRWYLIDWKSNHLGDTIDDYGTAALERAMLDHHYYLQLALYSVAVHRYLRRRQPHYDYDRHFGGAAYAFLRGLGRGDGTGWVPVRLPRALVDALDALLEGTAADGGFGDPSSCQEGDA